MNPVRKNLILIFVLFSVFAAELIFTSPAHALSIAARIGDQYTEVVGGDRLYFEVEIKYPENPRRKDLRLEYQIFENEIVIASEKALRAVETQASFLDYIVVPKGAKSGIHELNVVITDYAVLHQEVSATFKVLKGRDRVVNYFLILLGAIALVGVLVVIQLIYGGRGNSGGGIKLQSYSHVSKDERLYYEIAASIIAQTLSLVGEKAIKAAQGIDGLEVDEKTGKVLRIRGDPAKVISSLIRSVESNFGKRMSFALRVKNK
ncbi:MAG: hypothetical protein HYV52_00530 [Parcubacteria group bacterium]|nr:hypothetical protein [Parcubacteria group bacterium]